MTLNASIGRRLLRAGIIAADLAAWPAVAQQLAPQPAAPAAAAPTGPTAAPPWAQGRPEAAIGVPLAPIAPPPIPTAADKLPIEKLKAPKGFKIELYAAGVGNARTLRQGDKGTVFVGSRLLDKVYAIVDKGEKREVKPIYSELYRPKRPRLQGPRTVHRGALQNFEGRKDRGQPRQPAEAGRHLRRPAER